MIRPFTCVCVLLAGVSGLYLYQSKHRVQLLDREIENTVHQTQAARERTGVLRAEWTLMNDPERLSQLADRFMQLKTVTPGQFTTMAELDNRLPAIKIPDAKTPDAKAIDPSQEPVALAPDPAPAAPAVVASVAKPAPDPKAAAIKLAADRAKADQAKAEQARVAERKQHEASVQMALAAQNAASQAAAARVASHSLVTRVSTATPLPRPVPGAPYDQSAAYVPSSPIREARDARPMQSIAPAAPSVGSALGMARSNLPAPVPVSVPSYNQGNGN